MQPHGPHELAGTAIADLIPLLLVGVLALVYLCGTLALLQKKGGWSRWRTASFFTGMCLLGVAMLPSLMQWAHHDLRGHMVQHLLIGMFAPLFLVAGAPITLALKVLPVKAARGVTAVLRSSLFCFLSHPFTALFLNMGGMYLLYLTPLYNQSLSSPLLHYAIHLHFLAAGYLFAWSLTGPDPAPKRPGLRVRVFALFVSIAAHAFLSKAMYAYLFPFKSPHSHEQIQEAAKLMYYWGDLSELLLAIALFALWYQKRGKPAYQLSPLIP